MKQLLIALAALLSCETTMKQQEDALLTKCKESLPAGWSLTWENSSTLLVQRNEKIWVLSENRINAPLGLGTEQERIDRIKLHGKNVHAQLQFKVEERWSAEKLKKTKESNADLDAELAKLKEKYKVRLDRKGGEVVPPEVAEEYQKDVEKVESRRTKFPDYHSEKYSLFLLSKVGSEDDFHYVHPQEASAELWKIEQSMKENLGEK
jgi:hypothetical protein